MEKKKMMKTIHALLAASLLGGALTACGEKEDVAGGDAEGQYVSFTVGGGDTRTVRDENNKYQINWATGDKVRVYCGQCTSPASTSSTGGVPYADYTVNIDEQTANKGKLQYNEKGLLWNEKNANQTHRFYATYPSDATTDMDNGVATFKYGVDQVAKVTSKTAITDAIHTSGTALHAYTCAPDMSHAYMMAYTETSGTSVPVPLEFKPIMTTLDITVRNVGGENTDSITLTGLSLIDDHATYAGAGQGTFQYTVSKNGGTLKDGGTASTVTTYIDIADEHDNHFLTLQPGERVTFTAFLPPVPVSESRKLKVRVHCAGFAPNIVVLGGQTAGSSTLSFAASSLGNVKLNVKKTDGNNWITNLDDNIYVQQLSIPGTNGTMSYNVSGNSQTQASSFDIDKQLNMGIRAFDIHVSKKSLSSEYELQVDSKAVSGSESTFGNLMANKVIPFLRKNPGEFVVLFVTRDDNTWGTDFYNFKKSIENALVNVTESDGTKKTYITTWKKDLTIADCRGKVLVMTRKGSSELSRIGDWVSRMDDDFEETTSGYGSIKIWSGNSKNSTSQTTLYYFAKNSASSYTANNDTRFGYITSLLGKLKENASDFPWGVTFVAGSANNSDNTEGYKKNASYMHPKFFNWLNAQTDFGPLGIVFMDYLGSRTAVNDNNSTMPYVTYGDLLPEAIIDQNYRFTMRRKQ